MASKKTWKSRARLRLLGWRQANQAIEAARVECERLHRVRVALWEDREAARNEAAKWKQYCANARENAAGHASENTDLRHEFEDLRQAILTLTGDLETALADATYWQTQHDAWKLTAAEVAAERDTLTVELERKITSTYALSAEMCVVSDERDTARWVAVRLEQENAVLSAELEALRDDLDGDPGWSIGGLLDRIDSVLASVDPQAWPMERPHTPDVTHPDGSRTITVQRCCNGCGRALGDATTVELDGAILGELLPDVKGECGCEVAQ